MNEPSWWVEGANEIIRQAKKHVKWGDGEQPSATYSGIEWIRQRMSQVPNGLAKSSPVYLLEEDCRKLLEWRDGGR